MIWTGKICEDMKSCNLLVRQPPNFVFLVLCINAKKKKRLVSCPLAISKSNAVWTFLFHFYLINVVLIQMCHQHFLSCLCISKIRDKCDRILLAEMCFRSWVNNQEKKCIFFFQSELCWKPKSKLDLQTRSQRYVKSCASKNKRNFVSFHSIARSKTS